jgi:serine/threonine protein kinase
LQSDDGNKHVADTLAKHELLVGATFADRYEILSVLGTGGMSVVYKARHNLMKNLVAIKMLLPHMLLHPTNLKRFQQEAQAASALSHPNVMTVHDLGVTADGLPYLIMEYIEGCGLSDIIKVEGKLAPARALDFFIQACDGLAVAHDKGIIHRDLKPSNIMVVTTDDGKELVKIVDFGIAKLLPTEGEEAQRLTQTGECFGSPLYMSPEQCLAKPLDARADVYSLGCVLYESVTGKPPLLGGSIMDTMYKHIQEVPPGLGDAVPDARMREQLEAAFFKATAKDPAQRFQNMREFQASLEKIRAGADGGVLARLSSLMETAKLKSAPKLQKSKALILLALAVILLGALSAWAINSMLATGAEKYVEMSWVSLQPPPPPPKADYQKREKLTELLLNLARNKAGVDSISLVPRLRAFGEFRQRYHKWQGAAACYERALTILNETHATKDIDYYQTETDLADCYFELGRYKDAQPLYRGALDQLDAMLGNQDLAEPAGRLGLCYLNDRRLFDATNLLKWSVGLWEQSRAEGGAFDKAPEYALTLSSLGDAYRLSGKFSRAEDNYKKAREVWEKIDEIAARKNLTLTLYYLGEVQRLQGKINDAARSYEEARKAAELAYGPQHPYVANILYRYSDVLWEQKRWLESLEKLISANNIRRKA